MIDNRKYENNNDMQSTNQRNISTATRKNIINNSALVDKSEPTKILSEPNLENSLDIDASAHIDTIHDPLDSVSFIDSTVMPENFPEDTNVQISAHAKADSNSIFRTDKTNKVDNYNTNYDETTTESDVEIHSTRDADEPTLATEALQSIIVKDQNTQELDLSSKSIEIDKKIPSKRGRPKKII